MTKEELYSSEEAMSVEERERYYNEKVSKLIQFAYENSPEVKERLDKAGVKPSQIRTTRAVSYTHLTLPTILLV